MFCKFKLFECVNNLYKFEDEGSEGDEFKIDDKRVGFESSDVQGILPQDSRGVQ